MRFHSIEVRQATIPHQSSPRLEKPRNIPLDATEAARGRPARRSKGSALREPIAVDGSAGSPQSRGAATIYLGAAS